MEANDHSPSDRVWHVIRAAFRRRAVRAVVVALGFAYLAYQFCGIYFPLDGTKLGAPGEMESNTAPQWFIAKTLLEHGELPLWNPFVYTGVPFIGDPYFPINPLSIVPFVLFGPVNGPKIAAAGAVAMAGIGQYWLSRVLGHGRLVSLAAGVVGLSAGTLAKNIAIGFAPVLAQQHAWIAATLASFIVALRTKRPGAIAVATACYTFLYLAGGLLFFEVLSAVMVMFALAYAVRREVRVPGWPFRVDWGVVATAATVAAVAVLLLSINIIPTADLRTRVTKPTDIGFNGTQPLAATLFNFVVPDTRYWVRGVLDAMGPEIHYSYIGAGIFVFLLFLIPAHFYRPTRDLPVLLLGFILAISWTAARHTFMYEIWKRFDGMKLISWHALAVAVATVLLIPLCLTGADYLWRRVADARIMLDSVGPRLTWQSAPTGAPGAVGGSNMWSLGLVRPVLYLVLLIALWNVAADPFAVNRRIWRPVPYDLGKLEQMYAWLRTHDGSAYHIQSFDFSLSVGPTTIAHLRNGVAVLNSVWRLRLDLPKTPGAPNNGVLSPAPKYLVGPNNNNRPANSTLLAELEGSPAIFAAPPGLPFAFVVDQRQLPYGGPEAGVAAVAEGRVKAAPARFDGPNRIVVEVPAGLPPSATTLVVMQGSVPGWSARTALGERRPVQMAGGYLAIADARPGETYVFSYLPLTFLVGAGLTAVGVAVLVALLWLEYGSQDVRRRLTDRVGALGGAALGAYGRVRPAISAGETR